MVEGTVGRYAEGALDWLALRWSHVDGEDYGRGHVEEQIGDLKSLEGLMQAIVEGSAAAAKLTILVNPGGQTDAEELAEAENGAIIDGLPGDVAMLQANKFNDFRVAFQTTEILTQRLSQAFLLHSAATRDAERVTAEEIRFMAAELEDALGGVYSVLAEELQQPLVEALLSHRVADGAAPALSPGVIRPLIVTGLDALGRGDDFAKMQQFLAFAAQLGGLSASPIGQALQIEPILLRAGAAIGVDARALLKTAALTPDASALGLGFGSAASADAGALDPKALAALASAAAAATAE